MNGASPQMSEWEIVVRVNLVQLLASSATWRSFLRGIGKLSRRDVNLASKSVIWGMILATCSN